MKSFKEFLTESKAFKKGDKVKIKNVKSYDSMAKSDIGTVIDFMNKDTVMVKVGSGQMNVDLKDLQLSESTETNINEAIAGLKVDRNFTSMNSKASDVKDEWRDVKRAVKKSLDVSDKELEQIGDDIEDAVSDLKKALSKAQDKIKSWDK